MIFEKLEQSIKLLYPNCPITKVKNVYSIKENDPQATVKEFSFDISEGIAIDNKFIKLLSGLFESSDEIFRKECDGIVLFEHSGKNYCLLIELKSTFNAYNIDRARKQIISTYIKLNMSLNLLADYNKDDFIFIGMIVAKEPNAKDLEDIQKMAMLLNTDLKRKHLFLLNLFSKKQDVLSYDYYLEEKSYRLSPNCMYEKMKYCHVAVPPDNSIYKADIAKFL
ncbi:hypothetical protein Barb6_00554 [Bacteroidales bacterium Barb6]|nr:hypothetical protein Barb6_00554 [Bacteroidales bacterium Barb6]